MESPFRIYIDEYGDEPGQLLRTAKITFRAHQLCFAYSFYYDPLDRLSLHESKASKERAREGFRSSFLGYIGRELDAAMAEYDRRQESK